MYGLGSRGSIPGRDRFFLLATVSILAVVPTLLPVSWEPMALSLDVRRPEREASDSPPSGAGLKCVELCLNFRWPPLLLAHLMLLDLINFGT